MEKFSGTSSAITLKHKHTWWSPFFSYMEGFIIQRYKFQSGVVYQVLVYIWDAHLFV